MTAGAINLLGRQRTATGSSGYWTVLRGLLLAIGTSASILLLGRFYGLIGLALVWVPYVFFHPREGLWITPALVMVASLVSPPEGFQWGVGYSPELAYWAIAICLLFAIMLVCYFTGREKSISKQGLVALAAPPRAFYAFAAMSLVAATVGVVHGYALQNVAKQLFGCLLLCGYFLFALRFAPTQKDIEHVLSRTIFVGALCSVVYLGVYLYRVPELGFRKELTILATYAGGLNVLLMPQILSRKDGASSVHRFVLAAVLFAVPLLAQFKRAIAACVICGFLALGLRSASRRKRYVCLVVALLVFTIALTTNLLNPIGAWFSKYPTLENLFPEDVQSHYSVFLRVEEARQVLESLGSVPVLGTGLGSTITWYDPLTRVYWDQETLDVGWLYLLSKMGIAGTGVFVWFIYTLAAASLRKPISGLHLGLLLLLVFHLLQMVADPLFVYFLTAVWAGMTCGFLHILNNKNSEPESSQLSRGLFMHIEPAGDRKT